MYSFPFAAAAPLKTGGESSLYSASLLPETVTICGRICYKRRKINLSTVFAGQKVGVKQVSDKIWLVSFMQYDLGYFDHETCRLEPIENPFAAKVLPLCQEAHNGLSNSWNCCTASVR